MSHLAINHIINYTILCHIYLVKMIVQMTCVKINLQIMSRELRDRVTHAHLYFLIYSITHVL